MDPRTDDIRKAPNPHSRLMQAIAASNGPAPNFCPFGCADHDLNGHGYCHHLVGFTNGGPFYEPLRLSKKTKRIHVVGSSRAPMKPGMVMVRITTSARVYSPEGNPELAVAGNGDGTAESRRMMDRERELLEMADSIRNPRLEGSWGQTEYDAPPAVT